MAPLAALFLSDAVLGFHPLIPWVYGSFGFIVCIGFWARRQKGIWMLGLASIAGSLSFFFITHFGVWAALDRYPKTATGLVQCYVAGLPFLVNTALGDLFYVAFLFGGPALSEHWCVSIRPGAIVGSPRTSI